MSIVASGDVAGEMLTAITINDDSPADQVAYKSLQQETIEIQDELEHLWVDIGLTAEEQEEEKTRLARDVHKVYLHTFLPYREEKERLTKQVDELQQSIAKLRCILGESEQHKNIGVSSYREKLLALEIERNHLDSVRESRAKTVKDLLMKLHTLQTKMGETFEHEDEVSDLSISRIDVLQQCVILKASEADLRSMTLDQGVSRCVSIINQLGTQRLSDLDRTMLNAPNSLDISLETLERVSTRVQELQQVKNRREARVMQIGEEITKLWDELRVNVHNLIPEIEQEAFFCRVVGIDSKALQACEDELRVLREKKKEQTCTEKRKLQLLNASVEALREQIRDRWHQMEYDKSSQQYFSGMMNIPEESMTQHVVHQHQVELERLNDCVKIMTPLLKYVKIREAIIDERSEYEESMQNANRFMSRRPDMGRFLREEKLRIRIKKDLPKLTMLLRERISAWEQQHGSHFLWRGKRYLDYMEATDRAYEQAHPKRKERVKDLQRHIATVSSHNLSLDQQDSSQRPHHCSSVRSRSFTGDISEAVRPRSYSAAGQRSTVKSIRSFLRCPAHGKDKSGEKRVFGARGEMTKAKRKRESTGTASVLCDESRIADPYGVEKKPCKLSDHHRKKGKSIVVLRNCDDNPNCHYGLGEHQKGIWQGKKLIRRLFGDDPREFQRPTYPLSGGTDKSSGNGNTNGHLRKTDDGTNGEHNRKRGLVNDLSSHYLPCGLRNLGATCYLNSMLQCLFMNLPFRKAVYEWEPKEKNVNAQQVLQMRALQKLFALMQYGNKSMYDPHDFSSTLLLNNVLQQDAQEFTKLLLAHLRVIFSQSRITDHWNLVDRIFQGQMGYVTKCLRCKNKSTRPSSYYEISLNIKGHKSIEDCINSYLSAELLEGENKYFCDHCQSKERAERFIELEPKSLPHTITLQLMRFVYDVNAGKKKKLMDIIEINETLNMTEVLKRSGNAEAFNGNKDAIYRLSAYLNHRGKSAHVGHYTASVTYPSSVKNSSSTDWFEFDDNIVNNMSSMANADGTKERQGKTIRSRDAYMLLYVLDDPNTQRDAFSSLRPSESCMNEVQTLNCAFDAEIREYSDKVGELESRIQARLDAYSRFFEKDHPYPKSSSSSFYWIDTEWLRRWISGECSALQLVDNQSEDKDDSKLASATKNVALIESDEKEKDAEVETKQDENQKSHAGVADTAKSIEETIPFQEPMDVSRFCCVHSVCFGTAENRNSSADQKQAFRFSPEKVKEMKRISEEFFNYLKESCGIAETQHNISPTTQRRRKPIDKHCQPIVFEAPTYQCMACQGEFCNKLLDDAERLKEIQHELELLKFNGQVNEDAETFLMSRAWISSYKTHLHQLQKKLTQKASKKGKKGLNGDLKDHLTVDEEANDILWRSALNEDITCVHGKLSLEKKAYRTVPALTWAYFNAKFPCNTEYKGSTEPCSQCEVDESATEELLQGERAIRNEILAHPPLNRLYRRKTGFPGGGSVMLSDIFSPQVATMKSALHNAGRKFLISRAWMRKWREYIRDVEEDSPEALTSSTLVCPHQKLLLPQSILSLLRGSSVDSSTIEVEFINDDEMLRLAELYGVPDEWYYYGMMDANSQSILWKRCTLPSLLRGNQQVNGYKNGVQAMEVENGSDDIEDIICHECEETSQRRHMEELENFVNRIVNVQLLSQDQAVPTVDCTTIDANNAATGRRRSKRIRPDSRVSWPVSANANDTVYVLKTKIYQEVDRYPVHQRLYFKGNMLEDSFTLKQCGIKAGDTLFMRLSNEGDDVTPDDGQEREVGFEDSVFMLPHTSGLSGNSSSTLQESKVWVCPACTYVNEDTDDVCEMCTTEKTIEID